MDKKIENPKEEERRRKSWKVIKSTTSILLWKQHIRISCSCNLLFITIFIRISSPFNVHTQMIIIKHNYLHSTTSFLFHIFFPLIKKKAERKISSHIHWTKELKHIALDSRTATYHRLNDSYIVFIQCTDWI